MGRFLEMIDRSSMETYCDVDTIITQDFTDFWNEAFDNYGSPDDVVSPSSYTGELLGTSTDVSLYYTMSVTRNDAYDIAVPTPVSGGDATYTTTRTWDGQIVPTAQAARDQRPSEAGTSSMSTGSTSSFSSTLTKSRTYRTSRTSRTSSASRVSSTHRSGIATPSTSQSASDDYIDAVRAVEGCYPHNAIGHIDFNAPCNQVDAILAQCSYGPRALQILSQPFGSGEWLEFSPNWQKVSPETERTCLCQSQILDTGIGCLRCRKAHQLWVQNVKMEEYERAAMEKYCDVNYSVLQGFSEFSSDFSQEFFFDDDTQLGSYTTEIITSTDASLYYTLSVTRSDAYDIAMPTPATSGGNVIYTSTRTSDGQIVPTARAVKDPDASTTDSGAAAVHEGAAALFAMAALAALGL
jgi:hypothetical protein